MPLHLSSTLIPLTWILHSGHHAMERVNKMKGIILTVRLAMKNITHLLASFSRQNGLNYVRLKKRSKLVSRPVTFSKVAFRSKLSQNVELTHWLLALCVPLDSEIRGLANDRMRLCSCVRIIWQEAFITWLVFKLTSNTQSKSACFVLFLGWKMLSLCIMDKCIATRLSLHQSFSARHYNIFSAKIFSLRARLQVSKAIWETLQLGYLQASTAHVCIIMKN